MAVVIKGSGTVEGISVGGLPDGIVDTDMIAANAVTAAKRGAGAILQVAYQYKTSQTQVESAGAISELDSELRIDFTPKSSTSKIILEFDASYNCKNSTHLQWALFYDNTNTAGVALPPAKDSRSRVHWAMRTSNSDNNDANHCRMMIAVNNTNTTLRQYTIHFGTEGVTCEFYSSDLSTAAGQQLPAMFRVMEIAA
jgi:hypothetical protein